MMIISSCCLSTVIHTSSSGLSCFQCHKGLSVIFFLWMLCFPLFDFKSFLERWVFDLSMPCVVFSVQWPLPAADQWLLLPGSAWSLQGRLCLLKQKNRQNNRNAKRDDTLQFYKKETALKYVTSFKCFYSSRKQVTGLDKNQLVAVCVL